MIAVEIGEQDECSFDENDARRRRAGGDLVIGDSRCGRDSDFTDVNAATSFLSTLDEKQRQSVMFAFDDDKQRARWSNLPVSFVPRAGLSLKELNTAQRSAAMALVSSALSRRGFEKVQQIMEGDEVLRINDAQSTASR